MILANIGDVVQFDYAPLNKMERYTGRIIKVRDTDKDPIQYRTWFSSKFYSGHRTRRSRYLVTMSTLDGIRSFYTESISNARKLGLFERVRYWLNGKNFGKFSAR